MGKLKDAYAAKKEIDRLAVYIIKNYGTEPRASATSPMGESVVDVAIRLLVELQASREMIRTLNYRVESASADLAAIPWYAKRSKQYKTAMDTLSQVKR